MDAIKNSGPALGILCTDGIILATEKQATSVLLEKTIQSEKIYQVDGHIYCVASGLTADSNYLIDVAREVGQDFRMTYRNPMQVEQLVMRISDLKQSFTQYGGKRPFGTSFIFAGFDSRNGFQLFTTDPAGNYLKWKAIAHGNGRLNEVLEKPTRTPTSRKSTTMISMSKRASSWLLRRCARPSIQRVRHQKSVLSAYPSGNCHPEQEHLGRFLDFERNVDRRA
jgi:20S proteasome alpha/beta subunit